MQPFLLLCAFILLRRNGVEGFSASPTKATSPKLAPTQTQESGRGFGPPKAETANTPSTQQLKDELVGLISRMTGSDPDDLQRVEDLINTLESRYTPPATLGFLNTCIAGDWQFLFTTKRQRSPPHPNQFRLRELVQTITPSGQQGNLTTTATWDLAEHVPGHFGTTGTFKVHSPYTLPVGGARVVIPVDPPDHILQIKSGPVPSDPSGTVGYLFRSLPASLFDASDHGVDTTYMDATVRMVRYSGATLEGVRDIFMRVGSMEIPTTTASSSSSSTEEE